MTELPISLRLVGAGSQPAGDDELQYLAMPREMNVFRMPMVPERADAAALRESRDLLAAFLHDMERWDPASGAPGPRIDLARVADATLTTTNQMLGEGEVSIVIGGDTPLRIQESVFAGVWRVCALDGEGRLAGDSLEAAPLPDGVVAAARAAAAPRLVAVDPPPGAMNAPALVAEIEAQMHDRRPGAPAHVINLTLFPMTPDDHDQLARALPVGPVAMMSRGFGNCHITSTGARDVWRVQYFNSMNTLILDTIEIVDVPEVALAAPEDLADSRARIADLVEWMDESCEH